MSATHDALVVHSAAERQYCEALLAGFASRRPDVTVDFRFGISTALHERYLAERGSVDVIWSSAMDLQMTLARAGDAAPDATVARTLPASAVYRDCAFATTLEPLVTIVNRDLVDAARPAGTLAEIAAFVASDPARFEGRIAAFDIEKNGLGFLALLAESADAAAFDALLAAFKRTHPQLHPSNPPVVEAVATGRAALGFHVLASYAERAVKAHPHLAIARTNAPRIATSRIAFTCKDAPHPEAAHAFVAYLVSREGQNALGRAGLYPILDAPASGLAPIRIDRDFDRLLDASTRADLITRWREAVGRTSPVANMNGQR